MSETSTENPAPMDFEKDLAAVLNKYSMDDGCHTPDYILARYLMRCLDNFNEVNNERESWFGTPLRVAPSDRIR